MSLLAILLLTLGIFLAFERSEHHSAFRLSAGAALIGGGFLYFQGVALWRGRGPYYLRVAGWCLVAAALSVPSILTLGLVLAAPMAAVLVEVPAKRAPRSSASNAL